MFTITPLPFNSFTAYELLDPATGAAARVVPEYGATLLTLELPASNGSGEVRSVLVGPPDGASMIEDPKYRSSLLLPFVNRIRDGAYAFDGQRYELPLNEPARDVALHGFVFRQPFDLTASEATADSARLTLAYDAPGDAPGYPFPFRADVIYDLTSAGLTLTLRVRNTGPTALPLGVGWHPYFQLGGPIDELELRAPVSGAIETDPDRLLPTGVLGPEPGFRTGFTLGAQFIDQTFALDPRKAGERVETTLYRPATGETLTLWQDAGPDQFRFLHLYTDPSRTTLALEPVTSAPDAFNSGLGLIRLEAGATFEARCGITLS